MRAAAALASLPSAAALLAGTLCVHLLAALPAAAFMLSIAAVAAFIAWRLPRARLAALFVLGFAWCGWHASQSMALRLSPALEGEDLDVVVEVVDLPRIGTDGVRFDTRVLSARHGGAEIAIDGRVRLSWYGRVEAPAPGSQLALTVRFRRPRGVVNPGGFDFERHALERRLAATGYVRASHGEPTAGSAIGRIRTEFARELRGRFPGTRGALLAALAVGDQSALSEADWDVLRATGTAHLIAISGLHVGLVAGFGALLVRGVFLVWPLLALRVPRRRVECIAALGTAWSYSLVAGMSLPVQRTLLMIAVVLLATWARRALPASQALALALVAVLACDPLAALGAGFWLSFAGVGWLIFCLGGRGALPSFVAGFTRAQWAMGIALLPLTAWFFQQSSLAAPLANVAAVPWISFVVVPLLLLALLAWLLAPFAAGVMMQLAALAAGAIWAVLEPVAGWPWAEVFLPEPTLLAAMAATVGAFVLLLPRAVPGRALGALLFLPLVLPPLARPPPGQYDVRVLDVGQGLSVLVSTAHHDLLYDAGPRFRSGFDMGDAAVVPALRALGVSRLDRFVVSHADGDHAGGSASVVAALAPARREIGAEGTRCRAGERWSWDGVDFAYLHPDEAFPELGNDSSCVLRIASGAGVTLLPGDVSGLIEARLAESPAASLRATLLVSPHHGSRHSSTATFVDAVSPRVVVHSSGYRNRFGHPAAEVAARYRDAGTASFDTGLHGSIAARLGPDGLVSLEEARESAQRYWRE